MYEGVCASWAIWNPVGFLFPQNTRHILGQWELPTSTVLHSTNSLSNTQWSTWAKSAKALWRHYAQISEALHNISNDVDKKQETQTDSHTLYARLDILNVAFMAYLTGSTDIIFSVMIKWTENWSFSEKCFFFLTLLGGRRGTGFWLMFFFCWYYFSI